MTAEANKKSRTSRWGLHKRMKRRGHCLGILLSYYPCWFLFSECRVLIQLKLPKDLPWGSVSFCFLWWKEPISSIHHYLPVTQSIKCFLWLINFVIALGQCALAGATASYYWALKNLMTSHLSTFTAFGRAIR